MLAAVFDLARPLLFALDPEQAHELTLKSLEAGIYPRPSAPDDARLAAQPVGPRRCPIRSASPPASTRMRACPTPCCGWAAALPRSAR